MMFDVIVVGARCAGAPTAMLLARAGYRVLLTDRGSFPSDTLSTHFVKVPGGAKLKRWNLLDQVKATNAPPIQRWMLDVGPLVLTGRATPLDGVGDAHCVRRRYLDTILVEAAVAAGAELRERFAVQELLWEDDRVVGVRGQSAGGAISEERCQIVVGADGMRSSVARAVGAPTYNERPSLTCAYFSYWSGLPVSGVELYQREGRMIIAFPTNDGLSMVFVEWPHGEFAAFRADVEGGFASTLDLAPSLAERVRNARREEPFSGTADLPSFFRKPYGPGWALVGDAGLHRDPITAQGITDAFRDADLLAGAIDDGLAGRRPLDDALAEYERQRNEAAGPVYDFICQLATLAPPPPRMVALLTALHGNQEDTDRFFGMLETSVPLPQFFSPESVGRIMAQAQAMA